MKTNPVLLLVTSNAASFELFRRLAEERGLPGEPRRACDLTIAAARIAGGGVGALLLDRDGTESAFAALEAGAAAAMRLASPGLRILVWSAASATGAAEGELASFAARLGLDGFLSSDASPAEAKAQLFSGAAEAERPPAPLSRSTVIAVMGAKGGAGATTTAVNLAAALTARGSVILAELRGSFGSLYSHFHPGRMVRGITSRDENQGAALPFWPVIGVAGLRLLFGPQSPAQCREWTGAEAVAVLSRLDGQADFVVLDLPVSLAEPNRSLLAVSHSLALALEPNAASLRLAKLMLAGIQSWTQAPVSIGAIVVKQRSEGESIPLLEMERELGVPILKVIPPAHESCILSERLHLPIVQSDPESLAADSFRALARCFPSSRTFLARQAS